MEYKTVDLPVPLRGLNQDENPNALADDDLIEAENVWFRGNTCGTRPGIETETAGEEYDAAIAGAPSMQAGVEYRWATDANRKHVVIAGGEVYTSDTTALGKGGATISSGGDYAWTFAEHRDTLYAAGGKAGDSIWKWVGTGNIAPVTFKSDKSVPPDGVAETDIDARYIFSKWNYGFICGMNGSTPDDDPMTVRHSALGNMDSWPIANTIGGSSAVGGFDSYGDNYTTGFGSFTDNKGDWLLVLTRRCIYSVIQTPDPLMPFYVDSVIQNGCVHQNAYVSLGTDSGEAIYLSQNGIHSIRQSQQHGDRSDQFLSWPIRKTFADLRRDRLSLACGAYWASEGIVAFLVTLGHAATAHNAILALDVRGVSEISAKTARWTIWKPAVSLNRIWTARCGSAYTLAPNREFLYGGTTDGRVVRFNPDSGSFTDCGTAFTSSIMTAHRSFGAQGVEKGLGDVWIHMQRGVGNSFSPVVMPVFDYGSRYGKPLPIRMEMSGSKFGSGKFGSARFSGKNSVQIKHAYGTGTGDSVAWKISTSGANEAFWLTSLSYQIAGQGEDRGD